MEREELVKQLQHQIVAYLNLEDIKAEDIQEDTFLFGDDIGLDSIDALELIVLMQKEYDISISDPNEGKDVLSSIGSMIDYIEKTKA